MVTRVRMLPILGTMLVGLFLISSPGSGDIRWRSTGQVVETSVRAVHATCVDVDIQEVAQYGGNLFTFSTFQVQEKIYGDIDDQFTLRIFGGEQAGMTIEFPMRPTFKPKEEVILLLGPDNKDGYPVVSIHGVYRIIRHPRTGANVVETSITGMTVYRAATGSAYSSTPRLVPVEDFIYSLRRLKVSEYK